MKSEDPERFEQNIRELIRHGALPLDDARTARARDEFLRGVLDSPGAAPESRPGRLSAVAAALLVCVTIFWAARTERAGLTPPEPSAGNSQSRTPSFSQNPLTGGNETLKGMLKSSGESTRGGLLVFSGRSTFPDGLIFSVHVEMMQERHARGRLDLILREESFGNLELENGAFDYEWKSTGPRCLRIAVTAPDGLQTLDMAKQLKLKDDERRWAFEFHAWDEGLVSGLGSELLELDDFSREARELVARFDAACVSEASFKERRGGLDAVLKKLQSRVETRVATTLFPAAVGEVFYTLRDLATSMQIFKWEDGKFAGPVSYYTNHKRGNTFRQDPFTFDALQRYLEEAVTIAGREFDLWILKDVRRAGPRPIHAELLKEQARHPGVPEFAGRLQNAVGEDLGRLEQEIRTIKNTKDR